MASDAGARLLEMMHQKGLISAPSNDGPSLLLPTPQVSSAPPQDEAATEHLTALFAQAFAGEPAAAAAAATAPPAGLPYLLPPPPRFVPVAPNPRGYFTSPSPVSNLPGGVHVPRFVDAEHMSAREIASTVGAQLRGASSGGDAYSEDYYYLQHRDSMKRKAAAAAASAAHASAPAGSGLSSVDRPAEVLRALRALRAGGGAGPDVTSLVSLNSTNGGGQLVPELPQTRKAKSDAKNASHADLIDKSRGWVKQNSVLGRVARSNLRTPREVFQGVALETSQVNPSSSFESGLWKLRQTATVVAELVDRIADVSRYSAAKAAGVAASLADAGSALSARPEWAPADQALSDLETLQDSLCRRLAAEMGLSGLEDDEARLLRLVWLPKGRRAALRAIPCLLPEHLTRFLEAASRMLVYLCCTSPDGSNSSNPAEREKANLDDAFARALVREFDALDLKACTSCMSLLLESQTPESIRAVVATPGGAEAVSGLVARAEALSARETDRRVAEEWAGVFDQFLDMAERGISEKEQQVGSG